MHIYIEDLLISLIDKVRKQETRLNIKIICSHLTISTFNTN